MRAPEFVGTYFKTFHAGEKHGRRTYFVEARSGEILGLVEWYPRWRQYIFEPGEIVLSNECLADLAQFLKNLGEKERRSA